MRSVKFFRKKKIEANDDYKCENLIKIFLMKTEFRVLF